MKRAITWLVTLVIVASGGFGAWRYEKAHAAPEVEWHTAPIEKKKITARVTASGTIQATVTVLVGAQVSGRIANLYADYNSTVTKHELIAQIDPDLFKAAVEQAHANWVQAKAGVDKAVAQEKDADLVLQRTKALFDQSLATAADLQTSETNVTVNKAATEVAKANLEQAVASLHQAQVNLSYCDIYSPIPGTVISRSVDVGQTVASSLSAPTLFTIAEDLRKMQVHVSVAEGDVGRLQAGMDATFTVDAFPGQSFKGKVSQIRNAATTTQNVVTYDGVVDVDNADLRLRPGMTATVTIIYAERDDAVSVPNSALRFHPPPEAASVFGSASPPGSHSARPAGSWAGGGGHARSASSVSSGGDGAPERKTVYVIRNGSPVPDHITVGLSDGTVSEVMKGDLKPGDEVVTDVAVAGKSAPANEGGGKPASTRMGRMF